MLVHILFGEASEEHVSPKSLPEDVSLWGGYLVLFGEAGLLSLGQAGLLSLGGLACSLWGRWLALFGALFGILFGESAVGLSLGKYMI